MLENLIGLVGIKKTEQEQNTLTQTEIEQECYRSQFSKYLMPVAYDTESKAFYCQDETIGLMFEVTPVLLMGLQDIKSLEGLFRIGYPDKTVLQFILYADPDLKMYYDYYEKTKQHAPDFIKKAYKSLRQFYENQVYGSPPVRNYRGFITIKMPVKDLTEHFIKEVSTNVLELLKAIGLNPIQCTAEDYLKIMRRLLNVRIDQNEMVYDKRCPLNRQVIYSDTEIEYNSSENFIQIKGHDYDENGNSILKTKYLRCVTPKSLPEEIGLFWTNLITGSYEGVSGDISQINTPFLLVLNVIVEDLKAKLHAKANLILTQQSFGSFIVSLRKKQEEYIWATGELDRGEKFFRIIPAVWLMGEDKEQVRTAVYRSIRLWESTGAVMQEDKYIARPLFCYSLPFGFYADSKILSLLDRDFIVPIQTLPAMLPVQTDFAGTGEPVLIFGGRKGQLIGFNMFAKGASNYNFFVAAPTGKGKSFTVNYLVTNYYGAGTKIRIVDIGGSYKKLVKIFNGKYLEFSPKTDLSLNPFSNINLDPDEFKYEVATITQIIVQMAISSTGKFSDNINQESATNLISKAVEWAISTYGRDATIDDVQEWLSKFPQYLDDASVLCKDDEKCVDDFKLIATHVAFNLDKFSSTGKYGKWFQGKNSINIGQDDFVVLELEHLKTLEDLFNVVVLQVLNEVTRDLYLSDRQSRRMIVVDEAWQFLQDTPQFQKVIEEGYRRARKYGGSFGIVTQSLLDLEQFGRVGRVINENSAFKFFLESTAFGKAKEHKIIDYEGILFNILTSIRYNAPKYSEIFIHTDEFGKGVARLMVDPYSYFVYTSNPQEMAEIESLVSQGMDWEEAINEMVKKYRSNK